MILIEAIKKLCSRQRLILQEEAVIHPAHRASATSNTKEQIIQHLGFDVNVSGVAARQIPSCSSARSFTGSVHPETNHSGGGKAPAMTPRMARCLQVTSKVFLHNKKGTRLGCVRQWQGEEGTKKCSIKVDGSERGASRNLMVEHA